MDAINKLVQGLFVGGVIVATIGHVAPFWWLFEAPLHFRQHYAVGFSVLALWFAITKSWRWLIPAGMAAAIHGLLLLSLVVPTQTMLPTGQSYKLISFNILAYNQHMADVRNWLQQEDADFVLLIELKDKQLAALALHELGYQHEIVMLRQDNFGIALFAKQEFSDAEIMEFSSTLPSVMVKLKVADAELIIVGTHPPPPIGQSSFAERNAIIQGIAQWVGDQESPVIVAGDFNNTVGSRHMQPLWNAGLRDSRQGFGAQWSWPTSLSALGIAIDHVFVPEDVFVKERRLGPGLGSDHRPVVVEFVY